MLEAVWTTASILHAELNTSRVHIAVASSDRSLRNQKWDVVSCKIGPSQAALTLTSPPGDPDATSTVTRMDLCLLLQDIDFQQDGSAKSVCKSLRGMISVPKESEGILMLTLGIMSPHVEVHPSKMIEKSRSPSSSRVPPALVLLSPFCPFFDSCWTTSFSLLGGTMSPHSATLWQGFSPFCPPESLESLLTVPTQPLSCHFLKHSLQTSRFCIPSHLEVSLGKSTYLLPSSRHS